MAEIFDASIQIQSVSKSFADPAGRRFDALRDIDLTIQSGECFSLLGPSGCGKTTLLRIIGGLEFPDGGTIVMGGRDVTALPPELLRKGRFDEIFFDDLPELDDRKEIFKIHLKKRGRSPSKYKVAHLAKITAGYTTGLEISSA